MMAGMMSCQKLSCGTPHVLPFTKLLSPGSPRKSIEYDDKAKYECFAGYTLGGKVGGKTKFQVKCKDSGALTDPEVCEPVKCGTAPHMPNSRPGISGIVFFGQDLVYRCDVGYTLDSTSHGASQYRRTCKKNGKISAAPVANPSKPCKPISAGKAPVIGNAKITEYGGKKAPSGDFNVFYPKGLEYRCNPGYSSNGSPSGATKFSTRVNSIGTFTPAVPAKCKRITYMVKGRVTNARSGSMLSGVTIRVEGSNSEADYQGGFFRLRGIPKGTVTIVYEMSGYITVKKEFKINANINSGGEGDVSMAPVMASGEWRSVVTWGGSPSDLDSWAKWGAWNKVCWTNTVSGGGGSSPKGTLEVDKTAGYGPETIYFENIGNCQSNCDIRYYIHDYTESGSMAQKGAEVTLYTGARVAGRWSIKDCAKSVTDSGNWWHVYTLDAKTSKLKWTCLSAQLIQTSVNHTRVQNSSSSFVDTSTIEEDSSFVDTSVIEADIAEMSAAAKPAEKKRPSLLLRNNRI